MSSPPAVLPVATSRRLLLLGAALLAAVGLLLAQVGRSPGRVLRLPLYDFEAFWSASQLNQAGLDPYDPQLLRPVQQQADPGLNDVLVMWPAPWTLTFLKPFCEMEAPWARLAWVLFLLGVLLVSVDVAWRHYGGDASLRWVGWLIAFTFLPSYFVLVVGQLGPLLLAGFVGFLVCMRRGQEAAAGAFLVLAAIKPQIGYLFWIALLLWVLRGRRLGLIAGGLLALGVVLAVPLLENPALLSQYWNAIAHRTQKNGHVSPLLASVVRMALGPDRFWLQLLPVLPGLVWLAWYWRKHRAAWSWDRQLPALLFASFLTAPYGAWPFDLVVLLPGLLQVAVVLCHADRRTQLSALLVHAAISLVALAQLLMQVEYFWFVWMTPALLLAYLLFARAPQGRPELAPAA